MYRPKPPQTPTEILQARQHWADYCRTRLHPNKECCKCHTTYPNDSQHFTTNANGRITSTCIGCDHAQTQRAKLLERSGPAKAMCPICDEVSVLVVDHKAPHPTRLCRRCLTALNMLASMTRVGPVLGAGRLVEYIRWKYTK
jgi:hypothetical protein